MSASKTKQRPAMSPEERESYLIKLATDKVEERIRENKATAAELVHYLKLGSPKERLAREKEEEEVKLLKAKTESLQSQKRLEEVYVKALEAMKTYSGNSEEPTIFDDGAFE